MEAAERAGEDWGGAGVQAGARSGRQAYLQARQQRAGPTHPQEQCGGVEGRRATEMRCRRARIGGWEGLVLARPGAPTDGRTDLQPETGCCCARLAPRSGRPHCPGPGQRADEQGGHGKTQLEHWHSAACFDQANSARVRGLVEMSDSDSESRCQSRSRCYAAAAAWQVATHLES